MCIVVFSYRTNEAYPLVLLANRDEYYQRPTAALTSWHNPSGIIAPQDLQSNGTNIGYNKYGQWAVLTNYRAPESIKTSALSRGYIPYAYLEKKQTPKDFIPNLKKLSKQTNPFNLLFGNTETAYYYSSMQNKVQTLMPGYYALSNKDLDTPWPKVTHLKKKFITAMENNMPVEKLWTLMQDRTIAKDAELPQTNIPLAWERALSAIFVATPEYGTRATYLLMQTGNELTLQEQVY